MTAGKTASRHLASKMAISADLRRLIFKMSFMWQNQWVTLIVCSFLVIYGIPVESFESPGNDCHCIRTSSDFIPRRMVQRLEIRPEGATCRFTEIIITKKNNATVCVTPDAPWIVRLISELQKKNKMKRHAKRSTTEDNLKKM
ncbi:hypothetical protein UPYG_G00190810 [Umbra pygmaea]|uniref:Chemokine interleukin-8-like domain-containing protein n=1 Tax=Umbra pygmaea TaxID=75934 RepID=A0ABD0WSS6_UMBPY